MRDVKVANAWSGLHLCRKPQFIVKEEIVEERKCGVSVQDNAERD